MIELKDVSYSIDGNVILSNINLKIQEGEFAAIIGPNGAGKSTLIKIILNIITDYTGDVLIDGVDSVNWLKDNLIGYLPQHEDFDRSFPATAEDIVLMGLAGKKGLFNNFNKNDREKSAEVLAFVNALHLKDRKIGSLSGGELQRVYIARAIITGSKFYFLDEPEAGVDSRQIVDFYDLLVKLNNQNKTVLLVSHDINMISKYASFLICLNKTLHCHSKTELVNSQVIEKTYGSVMKLVEKEY